MSSTINVKADFFICSICNDQFSDPRSLPCLHSFCRECLSQHISYSATASPPSFRCPICRRTTRVPHKKKPMQTWVDFFPGNFWMKDLMSRVGDKTAHGILKCPAHPTEDVTDQCHSCRVLACSICLTERHKLCGLSSAEPDHSSCTETLGIAIQHIGECTRRVEEELAYMSGQMEKAKEGVTRHAAHLYIAVDSAKKEMYDKIDRKHEELQESLHKQLGIDRKYLEDLLNLKTRTETIVAPGSSMYTAESSSLRKDIEDILQRISLSEMRPCDRMRMSFNPDFSAFKSNFTLGTIQVYNSNIPADPENEHGRPPVHMTRSCSSDQLMSSGQDGHDRGTADVTVPKTSPLTRPASLAVMESSAGTACSNKDTCIPGELSKDLPTILVDQPSYVVDDTADEKFRKLNEYQKQRSREDVSRHSTPVNNKSVDGITRIALIPPTATANRPWMTENTLETVNIQSNLPIGTRREHDVISSEVVKRFPTHLPDEDHLPIVTAIVVLSDTSLVLVDRANSCIKVFFNDTFLSSLTLKRIPHGVAEASADRIMLSFPQDKELALMCTGNEPKLVSEFKVQKSYTRLLPYRLGIVAALCLQLASVELLTLQGKVMKTFRILSQPRVDIPFFVNYNQELTAFDCVNSVLVRMSKSGRILSESTLPDSNGRDMADMVPTPSGDICMLYKGELAIVRLTGEFRGYLQSVFSCQCMCLCKGGQLYVMESGGECKLLNLH